MSQPLQTQLTEYIVLPVLYDSIFHIHNFNNLRTFIIYLFFIRQMMRVNHLHSYILLSMAPLLSYYATHDTAIKFAMASLIYSENPIEGMYISLNTILISEYYSIYHVYLFHILYILCRNNLAISHIALEARSIEIHFTTKRILDFSERIEMFIENCDQFFNKLMMASIEQNAYTYINNKLIYK